MPAVQVEPAAQTRIVGQRRVQSLVGPFLGTAFYIIAAEYLSRYFEQFMIIFGIILLLVLRYAPDGLWGIARRLARRSIGS